MAVINNLRLIGISGTNKVMAGELSRVARRAIDGVRIPQPKKQGLGALLYPFDKEVAAVATTYHRTCSRVLWDLFESDARRLEPLYDELLADMKADDRSWLWDGASISIRARNVQSFAAGERQVVGAVKNALVEGAEARGMHLRIDADNPDIEIAVRMHDSTISVSVDLGGGPMHKRGYRVCAGDAPLRENLAAVLLMLGRHDARKECLIDPMAGSGTIAIEAVLMARGASLWSEQRTPAYLRLPAFADFKLRTTDLFPESQPLVVASDIDIRAVEMIRANAEAAGVSDSLHVMHADLRDLSPRVLAKRVGEAWKDKEPGLILSNPPYGERLAGGEVALYDDMGAWCENFPGFRAGFLVAHAEFEEAFGARARVRKPISNASLRAYFHLYDL
jgi:23S rRNA G2445 N2-methylase RlmL